MKTLVMILFSLSVHAQVSRPAQTFVSHGLTTRFLFFKIENAVLRFHVDANLGDQQLDIVVKALSGSCLKAPGDDMSCETSRRSSVLVDRAFFSDIDLSKVDHWMRANAPSGLWKLVCASGGDDCFDPSERIHQFKLTASRGARDHRILAHGFEAQVTRVASKMRRSPSSEAPKTLDRVYVTRTTKQVIPQLPVGTL